MLCSRKPRIRGLMYWSDVAWSGWCASALFTSRIVCSQHDRWRYCQWYEFLCIIFNGIYYISYFCCCKCQVSTLGMKTRKLHQPILKHKTDTTWLCEKSCVTTNFICLANRCRLKCGCHWKLPPSLFRDLILSGSDTCIGLINSLIHRYLDDAASTDAISEKLKQVCPSLYRNEVKLS